jgi:hypothetical protein
VRGLTTEEADALRECARPCAPEDEPEITDYPDAIALHEALVARGLLVVVVETYWRPVPGWPGVEEEWDAEFFRLTPLGRLALLCDAAVRAGLS